MNDLIQRLVAGDLTYVVVSVAVFVTVIALYLAIRQLFASRINVVKRRLERTVSHKTLPMMESGSALPMADSVSFFQRSLTPLARVAKPSTEKELGRLRGSLAHAGFRTEQAMVYYLSTKVLLCVGMGALVLWYNSIRPQPLPYAALFTIFGMIAGFYLPSGWLRNRVKERQGQISRGLPDALDLTVTCVEAGLGLDAASDRVANEIRLSAPLLSQELSQTSVEMRAGVSRGDAFRRLADRTGVEEIRNLAAIIIQTEIFGTSVAKSLRVQSDAMRIRRMQKAEEKAAIVAVKLTVPLIFCILPSLFAVLMGPAVVRIIRILLPTLGSG
ncbi:MAG: type II secretion system F family protein [Pseudomonadota bacterium]